MTREPAFVLAGRGGAVVAEGVHTAFPRLADARAALASHSSPIVLGALPFDMSKPAALIRPQAVQFTETLPDWPLRELPTVRITQTIPDPEEHRARIGAALRRLRDPASGLHKVVLARALRLSAGGPLDARSIVHRLVANDAAANVYLADLTAARHEHQLVVDAMREALDPLCVDLQIARQPQLSKTAAVWHLYTPITGRLRETSTTALDLAVALHPTPAVGGVPAVAAAELINELEGDRGFYAGAIGWCDQRGDGRWVVSIRCAQLSADRRTADAHSGGGIVAESDPDDEVAETTTKFNTILSALGVQP